MDQKLQFVIMARSGRVPVLTLCQDFGIRRKTGHKYIKRYADMGSSGLKELSQLTNMPEPHRRRDNKGSHSRSGVHTPHGDQRRLQHP